MHHQQVWQQQLKYKYEPTIHTYSMSQHLWLGKSYLFLLSYPSAKLLADFIAAIYWVKLPQIYTENHATFPIQIRKITVQICGNFWVTQAWIKYGSEMLLTLEFSFGILLVHPYSFQLNRLRSMKKATCFNIQNYSHELLSGNDFADGCHNSRKDDFFEI